MPPRISEGVCTHAGSGPSRVRRRLFGTCGSDDSEHAVSVQGRAYVQQIGWQNIWEQAPGVPGPMPVHSQQRRPSNDKQQLRISTDSSRPAPQPAQPGNRTPNQWTATGESQWSAEMDQGKRPLRHDSDVNDLDMHNNGHVKNTTRNGTCGISTVCTQTALNVPVSDNGHVKLVQELHLWDLNGLVRAQFALCVPVSVAKQRPKLTQQVPTAEPNSAEYGNISENSPRNSI